MVYRSEEEIIAKVEYMVQHGNRIEIMMRRSLVEEDTEYANFLRGVHTGMEMMIHEILTFFLPGQFTIVDDNEDLG